MHNGTLMRSLLVSFAGILCLAGFMTASQSDTRVAEAAMKGDRDTVRQLLKGGADVNAPQGDGMTPLHWAAYKDDLEMADLFDLQDEIAQSIASALKVKLSATPAPFDQYKPSLPAYEALLKARHLHGTFRPDLYVRAKGYFEQAIALEDRKSVV